MSLTSLVKESDSPVRRFLEGELPDVRALRAAFRARLTAVEPVSPRAPGGKPPRWSTLGTAIDHRLRLALREDVPRERAVGAGVALASRPDFSDTATARALARCGAAVLDDLQDGAWRHRLADRALGVVRAGPVEEQLARACYAAALFEEVFRCPDPRRSHLLMTAGPRLTPAALLADVPAYAVADLAAMTALAGTALAAVRERVAPDRVTLAPSFAGSEDVGGADGDWLADGLLIDVKATVHPGALPLADVYQLAGYLLLDYHDEHRITEVGWYSARAGALIQFTCEDFLRLLGARRTLPALREGMYRLWHRGAPRPSGSRPPSPTAAPPGPAAAPPRPVRAPRADRDGRAQEHGSVICAFQDGTGRWHGRPAAADRQAARAAMSHRPVPGRPGARSPFAGQDLTVEIVPADTGTDLAPVLYRLDDGRLLPATWQVHELLDDPFLDGVPPASQAPAPGIRLEIGDARRRYCLSADPVDGDRVELTVLICSPDGIIHGELTGEMDSGDLDSIGRLIASAASACPAPPVPVPPAPVGTGVKAARPGAPWTPEAEQYLREGHKAGKSPAQLAQDLGRSENSIRWKLYGLELVPYPSDLVPAQRAVTAPEPPRAYTVEEKRQAHPRAYERWTPEEDARLSELHARNTPVSDMARELGRNEGAISARLERIIPPF